MAEWFCYLRPQRPGFSPSSMTAAEIDAWERHAERLDADTARGIVILAGPTLDDPAVGLLAFEADDEESARAYVAADPTVAEGHTTAELHPFRASFLRGRTAD
jgi:uncharacterized protein YciI